MSFSETLKKILEKNKVTFDSSSYKLTVQNYNEDNFEIDLSHLKPTSKKQSISNKKETTNFR